MKVTKTLQLQLITCQTDLAGTLGAFLSALNYASQYAYDNHVYGRYSLQTALYYDIREQFKLKSQMAVNCLRKVSSCYGLKDGEMPDHQITFKRKAMLLNYPRDYRLISESIVSVNTLSGRKKSEYKTGRHQAAIFANSLWVVKSSTLTQRRDGKIFLQVAVETEQSDADIMQCDGVVGIDLGIRNIAATTGSNNKSSFYGGGHLRHLRRQFAGQRQQLQSKGTRAAKRKLRVLSGREQRFVTAINHQIAKQIVGEAAVSFARPIFALENLAGIRKNKVKKQQRRELNSWAFAQLQQFIEYKALERGFPVIYVDPRYTSQMCSRCGHVERGNRIQDKHWFQCKACGYQSNDDRVGSINIRNRATASRYIREARGVCQSPPDATSDEPKAPPGELRAILVASPRF